MELTKILEAATGFLAALRPGRTDPHLGALDFGILEVALLVAALDGEIRPCEVAAFRRLARACRGYTEAGAEEALRRGLRRAGYVLALVQTKTGDADELLAAFADEALAAMPRGFVDGDLRDVRRAFVTWVAMGVSDGDYSDIERRAVASLAEAFRTERVQRVGQDAVTMAAVCPAYGAGAPAVAVTPALLAGVKLFEDGFLVRVEALLTDFADPAKSAEAERALAALVG